MNTFLGVPVRVRDEVFGNLYLTEKRTNVVRHARATTVTISVTATDRLCIHVTADASASPTATAAAAAWPATSQRSPAASKPASPNWWRLRPGRRPTVDRGPGDQGRRALPAPAVPGKAEVMTATTLSPNGSPSAVALPAGTTPTVVSITRDTGRCARTIGVVLVDSTGTRWQRTVDIERLATVVTATAGLVAAVGCVAAALRRPTARVDRLTMGPGGWVSFKGGEKPRPRGPRRPWWAVVLRARPLDR